MTHTKVYSRLLLLLMSIGILSYLVKGMFGYNEALYIGVVCGFLLFHLIVVRPIPKILAYYIVIAVIGTLFILINNELTAGKFFLPIVISSIGIALAISRTINSNIKFHLDLSAFIFWGMALFFFIYFAQHGNFSGAIGSSRNHVSVNLILSSCYYVIARRWNGISIPLYYPLIIVAISTIAVGASGIITSLIIFIGYFLDKGIKNVIPMLACVAIVYFSIDWVYFLNWIDDDLLRKIAYKLEHGDIRAGIIENYIEKLDFLRFIIGIPLEQTSWDLAGRSGSIISSSNLHNSYLLLHAKIGILSFIFIFGLMLVLIKLIKKDILVFFLFLAIIIRATTDTIAFSHGYHDWALLLVILYAVSGSNVNKVNSIVENENLSRIKKGESKNESYF